MNKTDTSLFKKYNIVYRFIDFYGDTGVKYFEFIGLIKDARDICKSLAMKYEVNLYNEDWLLIEEFEYTPYTLTLTF